MAESKEQLQRRFETIRDEKRTAANTAERIGNAFLAILPYLGIYLSKTDDDVAAGEIGFLKGFWIKVKGLFGFDEDGNIKANGIVASTIEALSGIIDRLQSSNYTGGEMTGSGWQLTNDDGDGNSRLEVDNLVVRMKAVFNELEVRKYVAMGGNYVFSPAASVIERVDYLDANGNVLGYEVIKVPLLARIGNALRVLLRRNNQQQKVVTIYRKVKSTEPIDMSLVMKFRCWIKADDGTTRTINTWHPGMLARCQTMDIAEIKDRSDAHHKGEQSDDGTTAWGNVFYWRLAVATGQDYMSIDGDGKKHSYVDLSNTSGEYANGSMAPGAGDDIVCFGGTKEEYSHLIIIETTGEDAPAIKELQGVGLQNNSRDNYEGEAINWSLTNKLKTRISPTSGNRFIAPEFIVETTGEPLYNEHYKGKAVGMVRADETRIAGEVGDVLLERYAEWSAGGYQIRVCTRAYYESIAHDEQIVIHPAVYERRHANLGDGYVMESDSPNASGNGHLFEATASGWADKGLVTESKSQLKVDIDGITASVSNMEGSVGEIRVQANRIDQSVADLNTGLERAGIHIDGEDSEINLVAGRVNFVNPDGDPYDEPKISIDPTNGTLHAVDGEFEGTVRAKTLFRNYHHLMLSHGETDTFVSHEYLCDLSLYMQGKIKNSDGTYSELTPEFRELPDVLFIGCRTPYDDTDSQGYAIRLPRPENYQGRMLDIYGEQNMGLTVNAAGAVTGHAYAVVHLNCCEEGQSGDSACFMYPFSTTPRDATFYFNDSFYGDDVNYAHIQLISSYMCVDAYNNIWRWLWVVTNKEHCRVTNFDFN